MIRAEDAGFHPIPASAHDVWAETNYFPFSIPDAGLSGCIYNVFRSGLGVCLSDVTIFDRCASHWEGLAYTDHQQHLPCPPCLTDYQLRNGVAVRVTHAPTDYRIDYVGFDNTELHYDVKGLMRPQDFNDPDQNPLATSGGTGWDNAFNGHFDMTAQVSGELILRGRHYAIDCLATMDHSWGPRLEHSNGSAVFLQAHIGRDFSVNALLAFNPEASGQPGPLLHGYVLQQDEVVALASGTGRIQRRGLFPTAIAFDLQDQRGKTYQLTGHFLTWAPWAPYASVIYYQGMTRWYLDGAEGYGAYQEVIGRATVARHGLAT
jgi:hypothetical protein